MQENAVDGATTLHVSGPLAGFSLEMTGKDVTALPEAAGLLPVGTRVNITYLGNEDLHDRVHAADVVRRHGLIPVPHISARRLHSSKELKTFLSALADVDAVSELFVVGGDPATAAGPFTDALGVIRTGLLHQMGAQKIGIAGYPEGHPLLTSDLLAEVLGAKVECIAAQGLEANVVTQFGFDSAPVLSWIAALRRSGIDAQVRVGVPGPAGIKRLLSYARRFGVSSSAGIARKYGFSITNLMGTAGPDAFIDQLAQRLHASDHGDVRLHFYTFGGLAATPRWVRNYAARGVAVDRSESVLPVYGLSCEKD